MLEVRIRACHVHGRFIAKDNKKPSVHAAPGAGKSAPRHQAHRAAAGLLSARAGEDRAALARRGQIHQGAQAQRILRPAKRGDVGIIVQGGMYNSVMRALQQLGLADVYGETSVPIYVLNVTYPLIDDEVAEFCASKKADADGRGRPAGIHRAGAQHHPAPPRHPDQDQRQGRAADGRRIHAAGRDQGRQGLSRAARARTLLGNAPPPPNASECSPIRRSRRSAKTRAAAAAGLLHRLSGAADLRRHEARGAGARRRITSPPTSAAICSRSCRRSISARTTMGYGLGPASSSAFNVKADKKPISVIGDGGFWHNGLTTSIGNAVYNKQDGVIMVVDNFYSAATGGQDILSSRALNPARSTNNTIVDAVEGRRRQMGAPDRPHLRRRQDARHAARGADHQGTAARR